MKHNNYKYFKQEKVVTIYIRKSVFRCNSKEKVSKKLTAF